MVGTDTWSVGANAGFITHRRRPLGMENMDDRLQSWAWQKKELRGCAPRSTGEIPGRIEGSLQRGTSWGRVCKGISLGRGLCGTMTRAGGRRGDGVLKGGKGKVQHQPRTLEGDSRMLALSEKEADKSVPEE